MAHSHSTQRYIPETLNRENISYIHYIEFHHSVYNIYNVFRHSVDTKTLIPKTRIFFSKPLKIAKIGQKKNCVTKGGHTCPPLGKRPAHTTQTKHYYKGSSDAVVISDAPTHTHAKNITHTENSPTCCFLCIQGSRGLYIQQPRATMPIVTLHQKKKIVLTNFVNESATFFKVSTFSSNTFFSSTMSLTK